MPFIKRTETNRAGVSDTAFLEAPVINNVAAKAYLMPSGEVKPHPFRRVTVPAHIDVNGNFVEETDAPEALHTSDQEWIFSSARLAEALRLYPGRVIMASGGNRDPLRPQTMDYEPDKMKAEEMKGLGIA